MEKLTISEWTMPLFFQMFACLRDDCSNNKQLTEKHFEQLFNCWLHISVEIDVWLVFASSIQAAVATP